MSVKDTALQSGFPYLTVLVAIPAISSFLTFLLGRMREVYAVVLAIVSSLLTISMIMIIILAFQTGQGGYQMVTEHDWVSNLGLHWYLGIDGISLFLVALIGLLTPLALYFSRSSKARSDFLAWILILQASCLGAFLSLDLLEFFIFFEFTLVPMYFLISLFGLGERNRAAIKFFIYTLFGSVFLFVSIIALAVIHANQTGNFTFSLLALENTRLSYFQEVLLLFGFSIAFFIKTPVFPFHTWSPLAYRESPTSGAIMLASIMAKLGTYGLIRFDLNLFPHASYRLGFIFLTLGVASIIYGAIVAASEHDLKRLVAYSSLSHLGFVVLGAFALSINGLTGAVLQMFNHGLFTAGFFIVILFVSEKFGLFDLSKLSGIQKSAPFLAGAFMVICLSGLGLPGLNGFVSEFLVLIGTFATHRWWAVVATGVIVISATYILWAYQRGFHRRELAPAQSSGDLPIKKRLLLLPILGAMFFVGLFPAPLLDRITPSVELINQRVLTANNISLPNRQALAKSTNSMESQGYKK